MGKASRQKKQQRRLPGTPRGAERPGVPVIPQIKFSHQYGAEFLLRVGPVFIGTWWLPQALAQNLASTGGKLPPPYGGVMKIDTGADGTCISLKAAEALGLKPTRVQPGYGAGGVTHNPVFLAAFELSVTDAQGKKSAIGWEQEALGIPNLHEHPTVSYGGHQMEMIGLLGRDILRHCRLVYDGNDGRLDFQFDLISLKIDPSR